MKENHITYRTDIKTHPDFISLYKRHVQDEILEPHKKNLEDEINMLIFEFEKQHNTIVDFEKSNITKPQPSKERMNLCLFIDLGTLLDGGK